MLGAVVGLNAALVRAQPAPEFVCSPTRAACEEAILAVCPGITGERIWLAAPAGGAADAAHVPHYALSATCGGAEKAVDDGRVLAAAQAAQLGVERLLEVQRSQARYRAARFALERERARFGLAGPIALLSASIAALAGSVGLIGWGVADDIGPPIGLGAVGALFSAVGLTAGSVKLRRLQGERRSINERIERLSAPIVAFTPSRGGADLRLTLRF
jgi:hypothetical protein